MAGSWTTRRPGRSPKDLRTSFDIATPSIDTQARLLSGGNLQRLILAREIDAGPKVMVAAQPTRGLDVGRHRGDPPDPAPASRGGDGDPAHQRGPRRDPRRRRSRRRHVRRLDRRVVRSGDGGHPQDRPAHDRAADEPPPGAPGGCPALVLAGDDPRRRRLRAGRQRDHPVVRGRRSGPGVPAHRGGGVRERRRAVGHAGQGDAADPDRTGLFARVPDAPVEHRGRRSVPARRVGRQRRRAVPDPAGGDPGHRRHPGDDARRGAGRRGVGLHPGHPASAARGQRDHHQPDAQLRGPVAGSSTGSSGRGARAASSRPSRSRPRPGCRA